jgi:hypothetical protein
MNSTLNNVLNATENLGVHKLTYQDELLIIKLRYIVFGYIFLPISIVGLILNGFTITVLLHARMKSFSTNIYLIALSIANIVCLINYIFLYSIRYLISNENFKKNIYDAHNLAYTAKTSIHGIVYENFLSMILWSWSPIFLTFQLFSIYLTCAVTVDRWIYLLYPLKAEHLCTIKRTLITIFCIFLFCVLFTLPRWFEVTYDKRIDPKTNLTFYYAKSTAFGNNKLIMIILRYYLYIIHVYGIPFTVLLVVNIGIIQKLIQMKKRKQVLLGMRSKKTDESHPLNKASSVNASGTNSRKIDPKITLMVITVVIAFFICQFPYLIFTILSVNYNTKWLHILKIFCDLLSVINCCINFLIYCLFSNMFRMIASEILMKTFRRSSSQRVQFLSNNVQLRQR